MNNSVVVEVEHISKKYCKSLYRSMLYGVADIGRNMVSLSSNPSKLRKDEFWAVDDISFEVKKGETLGIIGPNGAGKTTILKLLNGIFWPDKGKITIKGRVSALIAVGAGFHMQLTGRENIYVNGAILGMSKSEIDKKFDSIVDFADIGDFLDSPVKFYSSGMFVRLGFSVAVHCEPEILLVDEILAVGDMNFQRKCHKHMRSLREKGASIIIISHSMTIIQWLCQHGLWLEHGKVQASGKATKVIMRYIDAVNQQGGSARSLTYDGLRFGTGEVEITDIKIVNSHRQPTNLIHAGESLRIMVHYQVNKPVDEAIFRIWIKDLATNIMVATADSRKGNARIRLAKRGILDCIFKPVLLRPRQYSISAAVSSSDFTVAYDRWGDAAFFTVSAEGLGNDITLVHGHSDLVVLPYTIQHKPEDTE